MSRTRQPHHPPHCIVPPFMLDAIVSQGDEDQRERALASLQHDQTLRARRETVAATVAPAQPTRPLGADEAVAAQKSRSIHDTNHTQTLPGRLVRAEGDPVTGDADADRVYDGFGATWDLYYEVFGRDSFDNAGATLTGTVHYGVRYDNAFWDGTQMVFGDGDGRLFSSFTAAIDVMGHELTHAVTERESGLEYHDQPGALNESLSDVFGSLVKQRAASPQQTADEADWLIGAGILGPGVNGVALRSMKEPGTAYDDPVLGKDPQPGHMDDYVVTRDDNGGVHINSGIPNHAFYLFAIALGGYAWERAGSVWYAAATDDALASDADFQQFANLTVAQATQGGDDEVAQACAAAWAGVGITVTVAGADPAALD